MRLLVAPNHNLFGRKTQIEETLDKIHELYKIETLILNESQGACFWADMWAILEPQTIVIKVNGDNYTSIRDMFEKGKPTHLLAFVGDEHTADAVELANKYKIQKIIIR